MTNNFKIIILKNTHSIKNKLKTLNFILVLTLFALFASIFSLQKLNLKYSEPFFLMGFRMSISGLILILYSILSKNIRAIKIKKIHLKFFIYLAIYNIYLNSIFEIWGLENMISSKVCLIYSTSPFITAIISFLILNEKLNVRKSIGIIIGLFGLMPIIYFKSRIENLTVNLSLPEISVMLAVVSSVLGWIYLKKIIKLGYSFIIANGISMFLGGTLILFHSFVFGENWNILPVKNWSYFIPLTIISIIISNIICYNLFGYLLKYFSTTFMTFAGLITPFFASFFGWLFLNENISNYFYLSTIIFLVGLLIFYKEEHKKNLK